MLNSVNQSENVQIVAALIGNYNHRHGRDKLQQEVARAVADAEHINHVQVFEVHLVLDVYSQDWLH